MPNYSFKEILQLFSEKLHAAPPEEDLAKGVVELVIDNQHVIISQGKLEGSLHMQTVLGLVLQSIPEERLHELTSSNFLGINTGGCKLSLDDLGVALSLHSHTSCGNSPQENWEWLHRLICVAREWIKVLGMWDEFILLANPTEEYKKDDSTGKTARAVRRT